MNTNDREAEEVDISKNMDLEVYGASIDESIIMTPYGMAVVSSPKTLIQSLNEDLNLYQAESYTVANPNV